MSDDEFSTFGGESPLFAPILGDIGRFQLAQETLMLQGITRVMIDKIILFVKQIQETNEDWLRSVADVPVEILQPYARSYTHVNRMQPLVEYLVWCAFRVSEPDISVKRKAAIVSTDPVDSEMYLGFLLRGLNDNVERIDKSIGQQTSEFERVLLECYAEKRLADAFARDRMREGEKPRMKYNCWFWRIPQLGDDVVGYLQLTPSLRVTVHQDTYDKALKMAYPVTLSGPG